MSSRSGFEIDDEHGPGASEGEESLAVRRGIAGAVAWRAALDAHQQATTVDHQDFYGLTRELVDTLRPITTLMRLLVRQVDGYAESLPEGERAYDDTRTDDPVELLAQAAEILDDIAVKTVWTVLELNRFWSLIGRIGVETAPTPAISGDVADEPPTVVAR